jgi:hypothetical protein
MQVRRGKGGGRAFVKKNGAQNCGFVQYKKINRKKVQFCLERRFFLLTFAD